MFALDPDTELAIAVERNAARITEAERARLAQAQALPSFAYRARVSAGCLLERMRPRLQRALTRPLVGQRPCA
jgi:hypothetical protein